MYAADMRVTMDGRSPVTRARAYPRATRTPLRGRTAPALTHRILPHLGALLVIAAVAVALLSTVSRPQAPVPETWSTISVGPNTTLWELATLHPIVGLDTAGTVEAIRAENALESSVIHVGQTISVPAPASDTIAYAQR